MGVTGSYLISKLSDEHEVTGYERQKEKDFTAVCAWGTTKNELAEFASDCNLDFEDYLYHDGQKMEVIIEDKNNTKEDKLFIELNGLCTYNKAQLEHDMMKGHNVIFNKNVKLEEIYDDYDLIIDSTGLRAILPMSKNRIMIPCLEYRIKYKKRPYEDFFIKPFKGLTGYFWYFPLNENEAHVGAGDFYKKHNGFHVFLFFLDIYFHILLLQSYICLKNNIHEGLHLDWVLFLELWVFLRYSFQI